MRRIIAPKVDAVGRASTLARVIAAFAIACNGTIPVEPSRPAEAPSTSAPLSSASPPAEARVDAISIALKSVPNDFAVDGKLTEWGSLTATEQLDSNPSKALSRVGLALTDNGVLFAAELAGSAKSGFEIELSVEPPALAPVGEWFSRGGEPWAFDCEHVVESGPEGSIFKGRKKTPKEATDCQAKAAGYEQLVTTHKAEFISALRVRASGEMSQRGPNGVWIEVAPIAHQALATPDGYQLEAKLPLSVLPRLDAAPLRQLRVRIAKLSTPELTSEGLTAAPRLTLTFPTPVAFEPLAELRARTFAGLLNRLKYSAPTAFPPGLSYHPGQPDRIRCLAHQGPMALTVKDEPLYLKQADRGDVEVGLVKTYGDFLVLQKQGKIIEFIPLFGSIPVEYAQPTRIKGIVERGNELQVIAYRPDGLTQQYGWQSPAWVVFAVDDQATLRARTLSSDDLPTSDLLDSADKPFTVHSAREFQSGDLLEFGIKGKGLAVTETGTQPVNFHVAWKWDEASRHYKVTRGKRVE